MMIEKRHRSALGTEFCEAFYVSEERQFAGTGEKTVKIVGNDAAREHDIELFNIEKVLGIMEAEGIEARFTKESIGTAHMWA